MTPNAERICDGISAALKAHDLEAVPPLLALLAREDPRLARELYELFMARTDTSRTAAAIRLLAGEIERKGAANA